MSVNSAANTVILTHAGKLGDMLYSLMVGSWLHKKFGRQIHWVLPEGFGPFRYIENLLMAQEQTSRVTLVPHRIQNFDCGGQPYKFNPADYGIEGEYYNLGFRNSPNKFVPLFYAEEHGFGVDYDFTLNIPPGRPAWLENDLSARRSTELAMLFIRPDLKPLPNTEDLLELVRGMFVVERMHTWYCGIAVLCWMARIPAIVYRMSGHAPISLYFPYKRKMECVELQETPEQIARKRDGKIKQSVDYFLQKYPMENFRREWRLVQCEGGHGQIYVHDMFSGFKQLIETPVSLKLLGFEKVPVIPVSVSDFDSLESMKPIRIERDA